MNFYAGTLGQLVIVELFVFWIWLKVFLQAVKDKDGTIEHTKILLTSLGLVLNAFAIVGIMTLRIYQLLVNEWPFVWGIVIFYVLLAAGNIMFVIVACLGGNTKLLKWFFAATLAWTAYVTYASGLPL